MLTKDDKKWIQEQLKGRNQAHSTSIPVIDNYEGNPRLAELSGKIGKGKETLAERIEYEKLKFQNQLKKPKDNSTKNIKENNKVLSNNSDKLLNLKMNNESESKLQTQSFTLNNSGACQNYILAKESIFNDGDNIIYVNNKLLKEGGINSYQEREEKKRQEKYSNMVTFTLSGINKYTKLMSEQLENVGGLFTKNLPILLAGVATIGTIIAYFKNKGFRDWANKIIIETTKAIFNGIREIINESISKYFNGDRLNSTKSKTDNLTTTFDSSLLNPQSMIDYKNLKEKDLYGGTTSSAGNIDLNNYGTNGRKFDIASTEDRAKLRNSGVLSEDAITAMRNATMGSGRGRDTNLTGRRRLNTDSIKNFNNESERMKLSLPVPIIINDIQVGEKSSSITIQRYEEDSLKEGMKSAIKGARKLIITGIIKIYAPPKVVIPAKTYFADLGKNYQIIGDIQAFLTDQSWEDYQNNMNRDSSEIDKNYVQMVNTTKDFSVKLGDFENKNREKLAKQYGWSSTAFGTAIDKINDHFDPEIQASKKINEAIENTQKTNPPQQTQNQKQQSNATIPIPVSNNNDVNVYNVTDPNMDGNSDKYELK